KKRFRNSFFYQNFSERSRFGGNLDSIDPILTARRGEIFIKRYLECRDVDLILVLDVSKSQLFGAKFDLMCDCAENILKLANLAGDRVGFLIFTEKVEQYLEPRYDARSIWDILKNFQRNSSSTDPLPALNFLKKILKKSSVIFWISDFIYPNNSYRKIMRDMCILGRRHDLICLQIADSLDDCFCLGDACFFQDIESSSVALYKGNCSKYSRYLRDFVASKRKNLKMDMKQIGVKFIHATTGDSPDSILEKCLDKHLA
ncbi:MAG: VWA domain-containing protein, partial [Opitutales bacterium]|nr:VWA domain-containing protein [Opitutales bacterium]